MPGTEADPPRLRCAWLLGFVKGVRFRHFGGFWALEVWGYAVLGFGGSLLGRSGVSAFAVWASGFQV